MKKVITIFGTILFASVLFSSCKTNYVYTTVQVAKFASVENVMELQINSTLEEVIAKLGSKPYNIYSNQIEGYTIYTYKYKVVERKVNSNLINTKGGETAGTECYNGKEHNLFLLFKDRKLESFVTTDRRKDSDPLIMLSNTLYTISKEKGKYIIVPTSSEEPSSGIAIPFGKKKNLKTSP